MDFLKKFDLSGIHLFKFVAVVVLALLVLTVVMEYFTTTRGELRMGTDGVMSSSYPGAMEPAYDRDDVVEEGATLSQRNIALPPDGYTTGGDAEEYEVTDYRATIETRDADSTCAEIRELKEEEAIIFEHASEYERGCGYTFKVTNEEALRVLAIVEGFDPRELVENTRTIKQVVADYTSELEILQSKLVSIEETLSDAVAAYDDITAVAASARDAESLAKIIDSKIQIIERLTQRRIEVAAQIERLERSREQEHDRIEYTYFYLEVYENTYIDTDVLKDSWKSAIRSFVFDVNRILQEVSIGFITLVLFVAQYALYFIVLLFVAKYGWKFTRRIWDK